MPSMYIKNLFPEDVDYLIKLLKDTKPIEEERHWHIFRTLKYKKKFFKKENYSNGTNTSAV